MELDSVNFGMFSVADKVVKFVYTTDTTGKKELIGQGSFGAVYAATNPDTGQRLAIKEGTVASDKASKLMRDINLHSKLRHRNLVTYLGSYYEAGRLRIVMEQIRGGNLTELLQREGALNQVRLEICSLQILRGLAYLHSKSVVHNNLKGSNILVTDAGIMKISDFGLPQEGVVRHRFYTAPEVTGPAHCQSHQGDIWSFGCIYTEMKTGRLLSNSQPDLPCDLSPIQMDFLKRCFEADPKRRPCAEQLLEHDYLKDSPEMYAGLYGSPSIKHRSWLRGVTEFYAMDDSCLSSRYYSADITRGHEYDLDEDGIPKRKSSMGRRNAVKRFSSHSFNTPRDSARNRSRSETGNRSACCQSILEDDLPFHNYQFQDPCPHNLEVLSKHGSSYDDSGLYLSSYPKPKAVFTTSKAYAYSREDAIEKRKFVEYKPPQMPPCVSCVKIRDDLLATTEYALVRPSFAPSVAEIKTLVQVSIPRLKKGRDLLSLSTLVYDSANSCVKLTAIHAILELLYEGRIIPFKGFVPVESALRPTERKGAKGFTFDVLTDLFHAYTVLVTFMYLALLMGDHHVGMLDHIEHGANDVIKLLNIIINEKCKQREHPASEFVYIRAFLVEVVTRRIAIWRSIHKKPSIKSKYSNVQSANDLRNILTALQEPLSDVMTTNHALYKAVSETKTWFERTVFLQYVASQVKPGDGRFRVVKRLISFMIHQKHVGHKEWFPTVACFIYKRALAQVTTQELCQIVLDSEDGGIGLEEFLLHVQSSPKLKSSLPSVLSQCSSLVLHPCNLVREKYKNFMKKCDTEEALEQELKRTVLCSLRGLCKNITICDIRKQEDIVCLQGTFYDNRFVTCKISRDSIDNGGKTNVQNRLVQETQTLLRLNSSGSNSSIIEPLIYQKQCEPVFYIAQDLAGSPCLGTVLRQLRGQRSFIYLHCLLKELMLPIMRAVSYCHEKRILLRNLTADSFSARSDGNMKFEIKLKCLDMATEIENGNNVAGSINDPVPLLWAAPESLIALEYSEASDIYMLGHTMMEVLTIGCHPYNYLHQPAAEDKVIDILAYGLKPGELPYIPHQLSVVLSQCFITDPTKRPSLNTLIQAVRKIIRTYIDSSIVMTENAIDPPPLPSTQDFSITCGIPLKIQNIKSVTNLRKQKDEEEFASLENDEPGYESSETSNDDEPELVRCPYEASPQIQALGVDKDVNIKLSKVPLLDEIDGKQKQLLPLLKHENLIRLLGVITEPSSTYRYYLISDWTDNTNLFDTCRKLDSFREDGGICLDWCTGVAEGMAYLHDRHIIHCHLKAKYVHLKIQGDQIVPQIGHLGRSRLLRRTKLQPSITEATVHIPRATMKASRWAPREVNEYGTFSMRSDVASWGLMVWEVYKARSMPPDVVPARAVPYTFTAQKDILEEQCRQRPLDQSPDCPNWLHALIHICLLQPSHRRPLFRDILQCLLHRNPEDHHMFRMCERPIEVDPFSYDDHKSEYWIRGTLKQKEETRLRANIKKQFSSNTRPYSMAEDALYKQLYKQIYTAPRKRRDLSVYEPPIPEYDAPKNPVRETTPTNRKFRESVYEDMNRLSVVNPLYDQQAVEENPECQSDPEEESFYVQYNPPIRRKGKNNCGAAAAEQPNSPTGSDISCGSGSHGYTPDWTHRQKAVTLRHPSLRPLPPVPGSGQGSQVPEGQTYRKDAVSKEQTKSFDKPAFL